MQIFIKAIALAGCSKTFTLNDVYSNTSIHRVKKMIEQKEGIPINEFRLVFNGKQLQDGILSEHSGYHVQAIDINNGTRFYCLEQKWNPGIYYNDQLFQIEQEAQAVLETIPHEKFTLSFYNIQKESTIYLFLRTRGDIGTFVS